LEKAGLAVRRPSSTDRRARIIAVTDKGAALAAESTRIVDEVHATALASLPPTDREALLRTLRLLAQDALAVPSESPRPARRARQ
ncbi:MarR family winged helix-turn-helix transcriptional regulator, partial [Streptomyces sp. NPDC058301]|uniref:MarR family winged helix-turn-helix transcriptional regulator n=1 Tax=Streptomyces sp. NPDC058301 TaxID=3346436 RepID=UPI0036E13FE1